MFASLAHDIRELALEQVQFRELLYQITLRDLRLRYKQSIMGFGWAVFMPLVNTAVFFVVFQRMVPIDTGMPYLLFAYSGLLAWNFSASSFRFAVSSLTANMSLVTKVYFPREILPISAVIVSFVDLIVGSSVLVVLMVYYSVAPTWTLLLLPLVMLVHASFTMAIAMTLAMANLFYRDVKYLFEVVMTLWMFVTSVLYPMSLLPGKTGMVAAFNPMTPIIDAYRDVIIRGVVPGAGFGWATLLTAIVLLVGWLSFHRAEFRFAENI